MRYYLIDIDKNEHRIDFDYKGSDQFDIKSFSFNNESFYIKKLGPKFYISPDKLSWSKIAVQNSLESIVDNSKIYKVYKGYKPSGISNTNEGELITQMPGKVVRLLTKVGAEVKKGETLLILEAMKMENEIKSMADGVVSSILVEEGQALEVGQVMIEIE